MNLNEEIKALNLILDFYRESRWKFNAVYSQADALAVMSRYGGMGSINDLIICKVNGHNISIEDEPSVNREIHNLLSSIYEGCGLYGKKVLGEL